MGHDWLLLCGCRTERHKSKGMRHRRVSALAGTSAPSAVSQTPPLHPGKKVKKLAAAKAAKEAATTSKKAKAKALAELTPATAPHERRQRVGLLPDAPRTRLGPSLLPDMLLQTRPTVLFTGSVCFTWGQSCASLQSSGRLRSRERAA